jgi:hypothetical protein
MYYTYTAVGAAPELLLELLYPYTDIGFGIPPALL